MIREMVTIDEALCDGCGLCVPACHEAALEIVDGKARVVEDRLCDGMGDCLGHCPRGAIRIEKREVEAYNEAAVAARQKQLKAQAGKQATDATPAAHGGCPGSRMMHFESRGTGQDDPPTAYPSALRHWPVQLRLLPSSAPVLEGARLLICADCVPVAYGGFHAELLRDHAVVIACPKLDDPSGYVEKLAEMIRANDLQEITVARMEVPCCGGLLRMVMQARALAASAVTIHEVVIRVQGERKFMRLIDTHEMVV